MKLLIKPNDNTILHNLYMNHSTFHEGDSGIDLFIPDEIIIDGNSTIFINLQINLIYFPQDLIHLNIHFVLQSMYVFPSPY